MKSPTSDPVVRFSRLQGNVLWALLLCIPVIVWMLTAIVWPRGGIWPVLVTLIVLKATVDAGFAVARRTE